MQQWQFMRALKSAHCNAAPPCSTFPNISHYGRPIPRYPCFHPELHPPSIYLSQQETKDKNYEQTKSSSSEPFNHIQYDPYVQPVEGETSQDPRDKKTRLAS